MAIRTRETRDGTLEGIDEETGEVVWRQAKKRREIKPRRVGLRSGPKAPSSNARTLDTVEGPIKVHDVMDAKGRIVTIPVGVDPSTLPAKAWPFNQVTADNILSEIIGGGTVQKIGAMNGFPCARTIFKWMTDYPEFKRAMREARALRAEFYHDKVIESAEAPNDEDEVSQARLKVDAYKWAAKVGDPETYGEKVKHSGDANAPLGFAILTGVPVQEEKPIIDIPATPHVATTSGDEQ